MPPNNRYTFEICVDSPDAVAPAAAVADRIELCLGLDIGGLTPDIGMMELAASLGVETHVLIRVRSGDFTMTRDELSAELRRPTPLLVTPEEILSSLDEEES